MARGNPGAIALGPGILYIAVLATPEPADLVTAWSSVSANWLQLGYTDEGSTFNYSVNSETVEVAEELDPVRYALTSRELSVEFALAEITATNLKRALNGGTITTPGAGLVKFEPPLLGEEVRTMLGWEAEDHTERWVYRQCLQVGNIGVQRRKGSAKATLGCEFRVEKPASGTPFSALMSSPTRL
ncbi:phage tail tube protein [Streptosporangium sp. NPDC003464]